MLIPYISETLKSIVVNQKKAVVQGQMHTNLSRESTKRKLRQMTHEKRKT